MQTMKSSLLAKSITDVKAGRRVRRPTDREAAAIKKSVIIHAA